MDISPKARDTQDIIHRPHIKLKEKEDQNVDASVFLRRGKILMDIAGGGTWDEERRRRRREVQNQV